MKRSVRSVETVNEKDGPLKVRKLHPIKVTWNVFTFYYECEMKLFDGLHNLLERGIHTSIACFFYRSDAKVRREHAFRTGYTYM